MTKTFKFYTKNSTNNDFINLFPKYKYTTDYSSTLDDIIIGDVIKKNKYLFNDDIILTSSPLKANNDFIKAANFLANYKKNKKYYKIPYELGKMYTTSDGTRIVFHDDEIQIDSLFYKYSDFNNLDFLNTISEPTKNIIINITINIL